MVSSSSGKLEEPSNRNNSANTFAPKQDFLARLEPSWFPEHCRSTQWLWEPEYVAGWLQSAIMPCSNLIYMPNFLQGELRIDDVFLDQQNPQHPA